MNFTCAYLNEHAGWHEVVDEAERLGFDPEWDKDDGSPEWGDFCEWAAIDYLRSRNIIVRDDRDAPFLKARIVWTDAFDKFGNNDGDDPAAYFYSQSVADVIQELGYQCVLSSCFHNRFICSITAPDGEELCAGTVGYDDPRTFLPTDILRHLDSTQWDVSWTQL